MTAYEGLVHALDESTYHQLPGLSSTGAKQILRSPAHYSHYVSSPREEKDAYDVGSLVHAKVLGVGAKHTVYPDGDGPEEFEYTDEKTGEKKTTNNVLGANGALNTKNSKTFAAEARAHGLIPVKRVVARVVNKIAESVLQDDTARALVENGHPEVSMFATDPETGVALRGRLDYLRPSTITDLKTTAGEASEAGFVRDVYRHGYDVQYALYEHIYQLITGETLPWLWVVVETSAPYLAGVHRLGDDEQRMGREKARRAIDTYAACMESGRWPGYRTKNGGPIGIIRAPMYAIYEYQDAYEGDQP